MRIFMILFAFLSLSLAAPARADVEVGFWSQDEGLELLHAFFTVKGRVAGKPVDSNYGFTAKAITPMILFGSVPGRMDTAEPAYVAASHRHFKLTVDDATYGRLMALVAKWSNGGPKSYNLRKRNCVHFIGEAARIVGLDVYDDPKLIKKPAHYIDAIVARNPRLAAISTPRKK